jgi:hypothetical protein
MSLATETLDRIRQQEEFTSSYTTSAISEYGIMNVHEDELFNDLTHEQKLDYSDRSGAYPVLNIWKKHWMYLPELDQWVLVGHANTFHSEQSWYPDFVRIEGGYLLDVENAQLYQTVE